MYSRNNSNPFIQCLLNLTMSFLMCFTWYNYYYPSSGQALFHSFVRGSHLLPSQLPGEHTGHKAASMCGEPIWNAHYSSTFHHCQVQILYLVEVRHTWSSHLAQECYRTAGPSHKSCNGSMLAGQSPIHVLTGLVIAQLQ